MDTVRAAGAVLWREDGRRGVEVAVVHRPRHGDWSLPKGKLDAGESAPFAAVRELAEEAGCPAALGRRLGAVEYRLPDGRPKRVEYFSAIARDGRCETDGEVDELRWLSPGEALSTVDYDGDRAVLEEFTATAPGSGTVLLVRHAEAGGRGDWDGPDDRRPLAARGLRQATHLRKLLPLFGAATVHAAPPLRCAETVTGVATDLDVAVTREPLLSEEGYWDDPAAGVRRLREIAGGAKPGAAAVVCSQGGAIPHLVAILAAESGLSLPAVTWPDVPCAKGSAWVLSFAADALVGADYYESGG